MLFSELPLDPRLQQAVDEAGFVSCTEVQAQTLPLALAGRDVAVQSQTGTGKTAAFVLPILQAFVEGRARRALVVAPTRELATQVEGDARQLAAHLPVSTGSIYGGVAYEKQERLIREGTEFLVGTPGRILDFASKRLLRLGEIDMAVVDEADRLFDMGFYYDIYRILKAMPRPGQRQTMLFSATLDSKVRRLAAEFMASPAEISIEPQRITVSEVEQVLYHVGTHEKVPLLLGMLRTRAPRATLIFTNTKVAAEELAKRLSHNGLECFALTGDLPQRKREQTIEAIKQGRITRIVATDVAARGLHINDLDLVVNFDVPEDPENYVHRIGRTARAGKTGVAVTLACERYVEALEAIERLLTTRVPVGVVDETLLDEDRTAGRSMRRMHLPSLPTSTPRHAQSQQHGTSHAAPGGGPVKKRRRKRTSRRPGDSRQVAAPVQSRAQAPEKHSHDHTPHRHGFFSRVVRALRGK